MRGPVAVACALLVLAAAPAVRADVTIGSDLSAAPAATIGPNTTASSTSIPERTVIAPSSGIITSWSVKSGDMTPPPVRLVVIRRPAGTGDNTGEVVARSARFAPPTSNPESTGAQLRIYAGEYIGLELGAEGPGQYLAATPGSTVDVWTPPLDVFVPANPTPPPLQGELLASAVIEPDLDGDGRGDTSQDADDDGDGIDDGPDNCDAVVNPGQDDADRDGAGDACDGDRDGDRVPNASDVCPGLAAATANGCPATASPPPAPRVNSPPVVRFKTPASGTSVGASQRIELDVFDDAGAPTVTVFDDDGTICTLRAAPYSCTWRPTGADVGRATLLASAVDSNNRSTLGIVRVRVARFEADLTRRVRGRRVTGRLRLPAAVERALGCEGEVTVRRGRARRTVKLKRNCTYAVRLPRGRGKVRARFGGNPVVEPAR